MESNGQLHVIDTGALCTSLSVSLQLKLVLRRRRHSACGVQRRGVVTLTPPTRQ